MAEPVSFKSIPEINTVPWINLQNPAVAKNKSGAYSIKHFSFLVKPSSNFPGRGGMTVKNYPIFHVKKFRGMFIEPNYVMQIYKIYLISRLGGSGMLEKTALEISPIIVYFGVLAQNLSN